LYQRVFKGAAIRMSEKQAQAMARDERVSSVWENPQGELTGSITARSWNTDRIDERVSPRLDGNYSYCSTGKGVRAYVVDTGIWGGHNEFSNLNPDTGATRVPLGFDINAGFGTPNQSNNPQCGFGDLDPAGTGFPHPALHGTKVASVLGGRTLGVAPEVTLVPVRVTDCYGNVQGASTIQGLEWILQDPGYTAGTARVVNLSQVIRSAAPETIGAHPVEISLRTLIAHGITVVVGAGNSNVDAVAQNFVPARDSALIIVGASQGTNAADADSRWFDPSISRGSNFGPSVDLFAPGRNIMTALWSSVSAVSTPSDENQSTGSSYAAPMVAAAAARYLQFYPSESHAQIESRLVTNATSDVDGLNLVDRRNSANRLLYMSYGCKQRSCCL
jgi:hypothetical protein